MGCQNRQVRVEMRTGANGTIRIFETNFADRDEIRRLTETYDNDPTRREAGDGLRFEGTFEGGDLPSEVGNRNGLASVDSSFGTTSYYFEQFGQRANDWEVFKDRMNAGELWMKLAARFFELRMEGEEQKKEWREFADNILIPDALSGYMRYSAGKMVSQGQRVSARVRGENDRGPRTEDETFQVQVFTPLAAFAAERGWMTPEESQVVGLLGIDGWVSAGERDWSRRMIFEPIMKRNIQRFVPDVDPGEIDRNNEKMIWIGLSFLWWVNTSSEAVDILLASDAVAEDQKERLRKGDRMISIPGPFGFAIRGGPKPMESELVIETGAEPFNTNGDWDESLQSVRFNASIMPPEGRRDMTPTVFHAAWSVPDDSAQIEIFGELRLQGQPLAEYCLWEKTLEGDQRESWMNALDETRSSGDLSVLRKALEGLDGKGKRFRPPPTSLWEATGS